MSLEKYRADAARWVAQAQADLKAALGSVRNGNFEWAAFQAQQAGEKAIKGLWLHGANNPWGHSITSLINGFPDIDIRERLLALLDEGKKLDKLYIPTRYPNGLPDLIPSEAYTQTEAKEAISSAEKILNLVSSLMGRGEGI